MSMTVIEHIEVGSGGAASIEFVSVGDIPSEYTDLLLVFSLRTTRTGDVNADVAIRFNGSTTGYSTRTLLGDGSSATSRTNAAGTAGFSDVMATASSSTANTFSNGACYIPNYRSSVAKSVSIDTTNENNATLNYTQIIAGLWTGTDPITSISIVDLNSANYVEYSSATLYGITAGSDGTTTVS